MNYKIKDNLRSKVLSIKHTIRWSYMRNRQELKDKIDYFIIRFAWKVFKIDLYDIEDRRNFMKSPLDYDYVCLFDMKHEDIEVNSSLRTSTVIGNNITKCSFNSINS